MAISEEHKKAIERQKLESDARRKKLKEESKQRKIDAKKRRKQVEKQNKDYFNSVNKPKMTQPKLGVAPKELGIKGGRTKRLKRI